MLTDKRRYLNIFLVLVLFLGFVGSVFADALDYADVVESTVEGIPINTAGTMVLPYSKYYRNADVSLQEDFKSYVASKGFKLDTNTGKISGVKLSDTKEILAYMSKSGVNYKDITFESSQGNFVYNYDTSKKSYLVEKVGSVYNKNLGYFSPSQFQTVTNTKDDPSSNPADIGIFMGTKFKKISDDNLDIDELSRIESGGSHIVGENDFVKLMDGSTGEVVYRINGEAVTPETYFFLKSYEMPKLSQEDIQWTNNNLKSEDEGHYTLPVSSKSYAFDLKSLDFDSSAFLYTPLYEDGIYYKVDFDTQDVYYYSKISNSWIKSPMKYEVLKDSIAGLEIITDELRNEQFAGSSPKSFQVMPLDSTDAVVMFQKNWIEENCGSDGKSCTQSSCIGNWVNNACVADGIKGSKTSRAMSVAVQNGVGFNNDVSTSVVIKSNFPAPPDVYNEISEGDWIEVDGVIKQIKSKVNYDGVYVITFSDNSELVSYQGAEFNKEIKNDIQEEVKEYKSNPLDSDRYADFAKAGIPLSIEGYQSLLNSETGLNKEIEDINKEIALLGTSKENKAEVTQLKADKKLIEDKIKFANNVLQSIPDEMMYSVVTSLKPEQMQKFIDSQRTKDCGKGMLASVCKVFNFKNEKVFLSEAVYKQLDKFDVNEVMNDYNPQVYSLVANNIEGLEYDAKRNVFKEDGKDYDSLEEYKQALEIQKGECGDEVSCRQKIDLKLTIVSAGYNREKQEVDATRYSILALLQNPDQNALKALKIFGIETDYSSLPTWLGNEASSSICMAKIEGYLDKTLDNGGGVTRYGCDDDNELDANYNPKEIKACLDVLADIRAQRTPITPDNKTTISYSFYLKAPEAREIKYIVAMSYKQNGNIKKQILYNESTLSEGGKVKEYQYADVPLGDVSGIEANSFRIAIGAFYVDNGEYVNIGTPIYMASADTITVTIEDNGNSEGNSQASTQQGDETDGLSSPSLLDMMSI